MKDDKLFVTFDDPEVDMLVTEHADGDREIQIRPKGARKWGRTFPLRPVSVTEIAR